jgi:hypothetical protein
MSTEMMEKDKAKLERTLAYASAACSRKTELRTSIHEFSNERIEGVQLASYSLREASLELLLVAQLAQPDLVSIRRRVGDGQLNRGAARGGHG